MTLSFQDLMSVINKIPLSEWELKDGKAIKKIDDTTIQVTEYWISIRHNDIILKQHYWTNDLIGRIKSFQEQQAIAKQMAEYTPLAIQNLTKYLEEK